MTSTQTAEPKFRVLCFSFRGERVVKSNLSLEAAEALCDQCKRDPICRGMSFCVEQMNPKIEAAVRHTAQLHGGYHRGGEQPVEETLAPKPACPNCHDTGWVAYEEPVRCEDCEPVETPAPTPEATCDRCHAPHSTDDLHADGFTGAFVCESCHPAFRPVAKTATALRQQVDAERAQMEEARVTRASREAFTFTPYNPGEWLCETASGNAYLVRERGACSCPDAQYRCNARGLKCKHSIALSTHLIELGHLEPVKRPAPESRGDLAAISAKKNVVWGEVATF